MRHFTMIIPAAIDKHEIYRHEICIESGRKNKRLSHFKQVRFGNKLEIATSSPKRETSTRKDSFKIYVQA